MIAKGYKPKKSRGQNFLVDQNILRNIIKSAELASSDTVVEIGAGTGNLTVLLAQKVKRVIAIEIDKDLMPILVERCKEYPNIEVLNEDARTFDPTNYELRTSSYLVVANIPYNITSLLIRKFLEEAPQPSRCLFLIQKEVAQRICARPPQMSMLSLAVQYYADARILFSVSKNCFFPKPSVESAVIEIILKPEACGLPKEERDRFFSFANAGFHEKRKMLLGNLSRTFDIPKDALEAVFQKVELPLTVRAQELSVDQWLLLADALHGMIKVL